MLQERNKKARLPYRIFIFYLKPSIAGLYTIVYPQRRLLDNKPWSQVPPLHPRQYLPSFLSRTYILYVVPTHSSSSIFIEFCLNSSRSCRAFGHARGEKHRQYVRYTLSVSGCSCNYNVRQGAGWGRVPLTLPPWSYQTRAILSNATCSPSRQSRDESIYMVIRLRPCTNWVHPLILSPGTHYKNLQEEPRGRMSVVAKSSASGSSR